MQSDYSEVLSQPGLAKQNRAGHAQVIADLQLDDWAVGEKEIDIIKNKDGSLCELGHGAFGQVIKWPCDQGPLMHAHC